MPASRLPAHADDAGERRQVIRAVAVGAAGLAVTGLAELAVAALSGSVALLSDALHNLSVRRVPAASFGYRAACCGKDRCMTGRACRTDDFTPGWLDHVLDRTVALGYTRVGYAWRRRGWDDEPTPGELDGKHVLITGATSGIGLAAARGAAGLGARVHLLGRDRGHLAAAIQRLQAQVPAGVFVAERCDLADLAAVRRFAEDFTSRVPELRALVHNAGTMARARTETDEGHEVTVATHVLGPHLLTALSADVLAADGDARVIFQSSGGMYDARLAADDPEYCDGKYSGIRAYARTKRMQVVLAQQWADRLRDRNIAVHATHPGWVDTEGVRQFLPKFRLLTRPVIRTPQQGADTLVWLIAGPNRIERSGSFWHDRRVRPTRHLRDPGDTPQQRRRLWDFCVSATAAG